MKFPNIKLKKIHYLLLPFFLFLCSCSAQKTVTQKDRFVFPQQLKKYTDCNDALANNDFSAARKFPLTEAEEKLIMGGELLQNQDVEKATTILTELWDTNSTYKKLAVSMLYKYYFYHTKWDDFMNLVAHTDSFPSGFDVVKDYYKFPKEEIIFSEKESVLVPIQKLNYGKTPIIEVQINGKKKRFIVDTGFSFTAISPELAKECNVVQGTNFLDLVDANNIKEQGAAIPAYIQELNINGLNVLNHPVVITKNLKIKLLGVTVYKIDGVIGWNLLQQLSVQIDYKNKNILLSRSVREGENRRGINGIASPFVTVKIDNGNQLFLHFDTGADRLSLFSRAKKKIEQKATSGKSSISFGLNKNVKQKNRVVKDFRFFIKDYLFTLSKTNIEENKYSSETFVLLDGRIGNSPFLNGKIFFDYQNGAFEYSEE